MKMRIGAIGSIGMTAYNSIGLSGLSYGNGGVTDATNPASGISGTQESDESTKAGYKSSPAECQTCRERKYIDGSDENVSFKSAAHISPDAAGAAVRGHEGEHVSNAYTKAAQDGGEVVNASVSIHTAVCPECGRTYVSGGTTHTMIRYANESNPYQQNRKSVDAARLIGGKIDYGA
jgi:hypothetical protein